MYSFLATASPTPLIFLFLLTWCPCTVSGDRPRFTNVTDQAGIAHSHGIAMAPSLGRMTGGAAAGDFDGDGWVDLFFTQLGGHELLYRNNGDGTFSDVSALSGFDVARDTSGVASGDVDNDGDQDLYVTTFNERQNYLYLNDGQGRFSEQAVARGAAIRNDVVRQAYGAALGDYDRDGFLDVLTSDWGNAAHENQSRLLRNRGASRPGYFEDTTARAGLDVFPNSFGYRFTPSFTDLDRDGHTDIVFASDYRQSQLFWNNGDHTFTDGTVAAGVGVDENGMGSAIGDVDGDGDFDWFVTAIDHRPDGSPLTGNRLYLNRGNRTFEDATETAGVRDAGWAWGTTMFDYDNDGDLDLAATNGWPAADFWEDQSQLWENDGHGNFADVSREVGVVDELQGRGLVNLDYDRDGDLDLLIVNHHDQPVLYRNDGGNAANWLRFDLVGTLSNRNGLGAVITVTPDLDQDLTYVREVRSGDSYNSQSELTAHFGLGDRDSVDLVTIAWPGGSIQSLEQVATNQRLRVTQTPEPNGLGLSLLAFAFTMYASQHRRRSAKLHEAVFLRPNSH